MRVGIVPSDVPSCEFFRSRGPAQALAAQGEIETRLLTDELTVRYANRQHGFGIEPVGLTNPPNVDVVVLVRGVFPQRIHDVIRFLQRDGIAVVVDYDDAYDRLPPQLHALYKINPRLSPWYNWQHAKAAAALADLVTVSTPALRRYRRDSMVIRNAIPERYIQAGMQTDRKGDLVGWGGTVFGHPGDLRVCGSGVAQAIDVNDARFLNIGDGVNVKVDLGLRSEPEVSGIVPFMEYPRHLAKLDVAIAPLSQSSYAEAKSSLKMLESLAMGSQVVASDVREYIVLHDELRRWCEENDRPVPAMLARGRRRDWFRAVNQSLQQAGDATLRLQLASAAREFVRECYLLEDRAYQFGEAWEEAIKRRRAQRKAA